MVTKVVPVTAMLLRPHFQDLEMMMRPGMTTLTWTSMNIEKFLEALDDRVNRLCTLVETVNDTYPALTSPPPYLPTYLPSFYSCTHPPTRAFLILISSSLLSCVLIR